jgi:hypothetical protein
MSVFQLIFSLPEKLLPCFHASMTLQFCQHYMFLMQQMDVCSDLREEYRSLWFTEVLQILVFSEIVVGAPS